MAVKNFINFETTPPRTSARASKILSDILGYDVFCVFNSCRFKVVYSAMNIPVNSLRKLVDCNGKQFSATNLRVISCRTSGIYYLDPNDWNDLVDIIRAGGFRAIPNSEFPIASPCFKCKCDKYTTKGHYDVFVCDNCSTEYIWQTEI